MANKITGRVHRITPEQTITGKSGKAFTKRTLILDAARYDTHTGEKKFDNYPSIEFSGEQMNKLDEFKDEQTGEVKYFNSIRGYKVERYGDVEAKAQQAPAPNAGNEQQTAAAPAQEQQGDENQLPF